MILYLSGKGGIRDKDKQTLCFADFLGTGSDNLAGEGSGALQDFQLMFGEQ